MLTRRRCLSLLPWPWLAAAGLPAQGAAAQASVPLVVSAQRVAEPPLSWPRDYGAHPDTLIEWWSLKGEILQGKRPALGFHIVFFRWKVESAAENLSAFAPRQVIAARASLSDQAQGVLLHDQRIARVGFGLVDASADDLRIKLHDWSLARSGPAAQSVFQSSISAQDFKLDLRCQQTQAPMVHGEDGVIHKDVFTNSVTRYGSQAQLKVEGQLSYRQGKQAITGRAWLDHGWGKRMIAPGAVGSDWLCVNLDDGAALMVFRMRGEDGKAMWEGATLRQPGRPDRIYKHEEIRMTPGQTWRSPKTGGQYPVAWRISLASTGYSVRAHMNDQEVDGGNGVGDVFWEGLCDLLDAQGKVIGAGYLEMTGYAGQMIM